MGAAEATLFVAWMRFSTGTWRQDRFAKASRSGDDG